MSKLTKKDLITRITEKTDFSQKEAQAFTQAVIDSLKEILMEDNDIELRGFGTFTVISEEEKNVRNPQNGEKKFLDKHKRVKFKPGNDLNRF